MDAFLQSYQQHSRIPSSMYYWAFAYLLWRNALSLSFSLHIFTFFLPLWAFMCVWRNIPATTPCVCVVGVGFWGQLTEVSSLLPTCRVWESNSGPQTWQQELLCIESSYWPRISGVYVFRTPASCLCYKSSFHWWYPLMPWSLRFTLCWLPDPASWRAIPVFSSKNIIAWLILKPFIHFQLILVDSL